MDRREIVHLWAHKSRERAKAGNVFFEHETIYSYGHHFAIARHYKGVVLLTTRTYSSSTATHVSMVRQACSHLTTFHVFNPELDPCKADLKAYAERIVALELKAGRARVNADRCLKDLEAEIEEANAFAELFKFKTRFKASGDLSALKEKAKESAAREAKRDEIRRQQRDLAAREGVEKWLAGQQDYCPNTSRVYLRRNGDNMQTSRGAVVTLKAAQVAYRFALRHRDAGWRRNGEQCQVDAYELDSINSAGIVAGCHNITWEEIERFAALQGWSSVTCPASL